MAGSVFEVGDSPGSGRTANHGRVPLAGSHQIDPVHSFVRSRPQHRKLGSRR